MPHCKQAALVLHTSRQTDILTLCPAPTSQRETALTRTQADYMAGEVCICSQFIKYNIQQQAEATQEQHLSSWAFAGEMRRQTAT